MIVSFMFYVPQWHAIIYHLLFRRTKREMTVYPWCFSSVRHCFNALIKLFVDIRNYCRTMHIFCIIHNYVLWMRFVSSNSDILCFSVSGFYWCEFSWTLRCLHVLNFGISLSCYMCEDLVRMLLYAVVLLLVYRWL